MSIAKQTTFICSWGRAYRYIFMHVFQKICYLIALSQQGIGGCFYHNNGINEKG
jgi:hypothetical protein